MSFNPYELPDSPSQPARVPPILLDEHRGSGRPWGVVLLGLWHIVHGLIPAAALAFLFSIGQAPPLVNLGLPLFVVGLTIAIGVRVIRGENWGWRGASFFNVVQVVQPALSLVRGDQPSAWAMAEAVIGVGAFVYLFHDDVLRYFGMYGISKWATARRIIVICCILLAIITFTN